MTQISLNPEGHNLLSFLALATSQRYKELRKAGKTPRKAAETVKYDLNREVLQCVAVMQFFLGNRLELLTKTLEAVILKSDSPEVRLLASVALGR